MSTPTSPEPSLLVRVFIPEINAQKCVVVNPNDTVKAAQTVTLEKIAKTEKEPENYGLFLPSSHGRPGKFLDEERLLTDYALQGHVPQLELRYRCRDFINVPGMTEKQILKANTKANQKKFLELVSTNALRKVEKALATGMDANFIIDDGNTPLGMACGRFGNPSMILTLVSGGTHVDFCGKDGLLPIHRAAIGGNSKAIKTLLSLGASPNSKDSKGLTPLYHAVIMGDHPEVCETLLKDYAQVNTRDQHQWTELHHACKYGYSKHVDLLIKFKADMSAKNNVGNTPLHVAASHGQVDCALLLLRRGADKQIVNNSGQPVNQVAILCGHHQLSSVILRFSDSEIDRITALPNYNPHAKKKPSKTVPYYENFPLPSSPSSSSIAEALLNSAVQDEQKKTDATNGSSTPKLRVHNSASGVQSSRPQLYKSSSMSSPIRPPVKASAPAIGIPRDIYITKGPQGFGFAMRGIKVPTSTFKPTPEIPAFQFVGSIDQNGSADKASLKEGDYLIEANGHNIITSTHDEVVSIIMHSGNKLHLKVVTPSVKPTGLSPIHESPKVIAENKSATSPIRQTSLHVSQSIPSKPNPPAQVPTKHQTPQQAKTTVPRKPPPPPQGSNTVPPQESISPEMRATEPLQTRSAGKPPLTKALTVSDIVETKSQAPKFTKQLSEETIVLPSQFASPTETVNSQRNSLEAEDLSPFAIALKKASKEREVRISTNKPRMLTATSKNEPNITEEEEVSTPSVAAKGQASNPITLSATKKENKANSLGSAVESTVVEPDITSLATDSADSQDTQKSEIPLKKVPVNTLIRRFSGDSFPVMEGSQESTKSTPANVEKTDTNSDDRTPNSDSGNRELKGQKSITMIAKVFEGEKADDGTYNWRNMLKKSTSKPSIKSPTADEPSSSELPISTDTSVSERATNRQIQGSPLTTKNSKTSLLAKKFERNSVVKSNDVDTQKIENTPTKDFPTSEAPVKQISTFAIDETSVPTVEKVKEDSSTTITVDQPKVSSAVGQESLRRQSAVVMYEEGNVNLTNPYARNSVSVDGDYWKSPEHTSFPPVSELPPPDISSDTRIDHLMNEILAGSEILPTPELDVIPPPILPMNEELPPIESFLPPELFLPPEENDFLPPDMLPPPIVDDFSEGLPPPADFPENNFPQEARSLDVTTSHMNDLDTFELPSPSQLPPPQLSDREASFDSSSVPEFNIEELSPENKADVVITHNNTDSNNALLTASKLLPKAVNDSNILSDLTKSNDNALQPPDFSLTTSDVPPPQDYGSDEGIPPPMDCDQFLPTQTNHQLKSPVDEISPQDSDYKSKPVMEWTVDDVCSWLDEVGLEEHIEMFWDNEIQGSHLIDMTKDDLKELGITRLGHRMTIANGIAALLKK